MTGRRGCAAIVAYLPDGRTPVFCENAAGHDLDRAARPDCCDVCGKSAAVHARRWHGFVPDPGGVGSAHAARVEVGSVRQEQEQ